MYCRAFLFSRSANAFESKGKRKKTSPKGEALVLIAFKKEKPGDRHSQSLTLRQNQSLAMYCGAFLFSRSANAFESKGKRKKTSPKGEALVLIAFKKEKTRGSAQPIPHAPPKPKPCNVLRGFFVCFPTIGSVLELKQSIPNIFETRERLRNELNFSKNIPFYSLRDSGIMKLLEKGKNPE